MLACALTEGLKLLAASTSKILADSSDWLATVFLSFLVTQLVVWDSATISHHDRLGHSKCVIICMVPASRSVEDSAMLSDTNAHIQATAADAILHGVSRFPDGTGLAD